MENRRVERDYLDEDLRRLATDPGFRPAGWSDREVREFHRLVQCARAAHVEEDLRNMRVLRIESDDAGDPGRVCATLSSGRVIYLMFKNSGSHSAVVFGNL
jgi:plasmid maintenance system killer protein